MGQPAFDPGLTQQYTGALRRIVNRDGTFNVTRRGAGLSGVNLYLELISMSWKRFLLIVAASYIFVNFVFASIYHWLGADHIVASQTELPPFWNAFYFSAHTLTTVGYGSLAPRGMMMHAISALEAMVGLIGFALATSLTYGRVSRPSARFLFSDKMLVTPYRGITSLQFRVANARKNILMEIEAQMLMMTVVNEEGTLKRHYTPLTLERPNVHFMPLTWTVVHPINETSPLWGKTAEELAALQAEVMLLIKAFDDTFSQTVHARRSYRYNEIEWHARFEPAFHFTPEGDMVLDLEHLSRHQLV